MFLQVCVILFTGGHVWLSRGGVRGCSGVCGCSGGHAWLLLGGGGHAWLLQGGAWLLWGGCMVAPGGMHGCSGGGVHGCCQGGMRGCCQGVCMVAARGVCVGYDEIRRYYQWGGATHPTGMHSCCIYHHSLSFKKNKLPKQTDTEKNETHFLGKNTYLMQQDQLHDTKI